MKSWYIENGELSRLCTSETERASMHLWVGLNTDKGAYIYNRGDYGIDYSNILGKIPTALRLMDIEKDIKRTLNQFDSIEVDFTINSKNLNISVIVDTPDGVAQGERVALL